MSLLASKFFISSPTTTSKREKVECIYELVRWCYERVFDYGMYQGRIYWNVDTGAVCTEMSLGTICWADMLNVLNKPWFVCSNNKTVFYKGKEITIEYEFVDEQVCQASDVVSSLQQTLILDVKVSGKLFGKLLKTGSEFPMIPESIRNSLKATVDTALMNHL